MVAGDVVALAALVGVVALAELVGVVALVARLELDPLCLKPPFAEPECADLPALARDERTGVDVAPSAIEAVEVCELVGLTPATASPARVSTTTDTTMSIAQVPRLRGRRACWERYLL